VQLKSRLAGGMSRLRARAGRGAKHVKDAAHDLRQSPVLQHALAARERGNLEAAFWLLNEEFTERPDSPDVAVHYWDVALSLGRVDIASAAGVKLIESRAAEGEPELAAQHWIELIKEAPDVFVSPAAIATILPALKTRLAQAQDGGPDDRLTLGGYLRRAVRHAVDPRNSELHPGVALRIFEEGRDINPEAARRAAEAVLESPHLHEAKRERLTAWLAGESIDSSKPKAESAPEPESPVRSRPKPEPKPRLDAEPEPAGDTIGESLSADEIQAAASRLPRSKPAKNTPPSIEPELVEQPMLEVDPELLEQPILEVDAEPVEQPALEVEPELLEQPMIEVDAEPVEQSALEVEPELLEQPMIEVDAEPVEQSALDTEPLEQPMLEVEPEPKAPETPGQRITTGILTALDENGLVIDGIEGDRLAYADIQAVAVAEILGIEEVAVSFVDLILNWSSRNEEPLQIVRLRVDELDLETLVTRKHALGSDFAALMGEIMEQTSAVPLPDPESALGTRITCFESAELYQRVGLRVAA
jgi:hypothetical protein